MKKFISGLLLLILVIGALQAQRPLGTWESFLPYGDATQVVQSSDRIYCATPYSLFFIEKSDGSVTTMSKSTGLSDADVRNIAYDQAMNTLVITYASSNIDLLVNGTDIYNIPDIKNAVVSGSKNINDIACIGNYAYLATDLGISVLDLGQQQIMDNYNIGQTGGSVKVASIASDGTSIFAATSEGLKSAALSSPNLQDYNSWTVYGASSGLPAGACTLTGQINGRFYAVVQDTLYLDSNSFFYKVRYDTGMSYAGFSNTGGYLYAFLWPATLSSGKILQIQADGSITDVSQSQSPHPIQITTDGTTNWIADEWNGLCKYNSFNFVQAIIPNGPPGIGTFRMAVSDHTLYLASGGIDPEYITPDNNANGPVIYNHVLWQSYPLSYYGGLSECYDLVDVVVDKAHQKVYWASLQGGLVERDLATNTFTKYDTSNTGGALGSYYYENQTRITALCLDAAGNLWMSNSGPEDANSALVLKTYDGHWYKFTVPNALIAVRKMIVDANGYIWMGGRTSSAQNMVVYNPGQNLASTTDDQWVSLTTATGNGGLPNTNVSAIVSDNEGNVWVGTDIGIATFYCAGSIFAQGGGVGCDATLIKVDQGGYIGYLFSTQVVQALAVDGADRKWVGTSNGLWLISADGTQQLLQFNTDNSPLPNNSITDIQVDPQTGEVWIGTQDGLVSYQGDAILGGTTKGTAFVYPNPVKSDYTGPIAIKGLVENAYVKITDAAGTLVYEGEANGGQMIWNGQGYNGNRVSTGIYMVYADASDGSQHNVAKVIFVK